MSLGFSPAARNRAQANARSGHSVGQINSVGHLFGGGGDQGYGPGSPTVGRGRAG